jgi:hypothetical protein
VIVVLVVCVSALLAGAAPAGAVLKPKRPPLSTPWTAHVSKRLPLPEYPRPQLVRGRWLNLNGQWQFSSAAAGEAPPFGRRLRETILVPFPMQAALSGIERYERRSWYRRSFRVPPSWRGKRVQLNFGAVTHEATVWVNGRRIGFHKGSYDSFSFDITTALRRGENELIVGVYDDITKGGQPTGKQSPTSAGVFYTASSGIWQTVWIEPVERTHVSRLVLTPDLRRDRLLVALHAPRARGTTALLRARDGRRVVARATGRPGRRIALRIRKPRLWSPGRPFLYDLDLVLRRGRRVLDRVESYFGMRSVAIRRVGGVPRIVLNGRFGFQTGALDQGYWPDGVYTAPTDGALAFDLRAHKRMGFNLVRKHLKVEPQRWYTHADRLGLLVWQDMPSMPIYKPVTRPAERQFERELRELIDEHRSSPSIISWIPFNEGWGEFDVDRITGLTKRLDPSRLVNGNSGAANCCATIEPSAGDIRDTHTYMGPFGIEPDERASVTGEFGGVFARSDGHEWDPRGKYPLAPTRQASEGLMRSLWAALGQEMRTPGLSGALFTQITDVEQQLSGLITFDRRVHKVSPRLVRRLNIDLIRASRRPANLGPQPGEVPGAATGVWSFDEGSGGVARDSSGHGNDLTLENGARWDAGHHGSALRVSGSGQRARAAGPVVDTRGSFTVAAWLRQDDPRQTATAIGQDGDGLSGFSLGIVFGSQRPYTLRGYDDQPGPHKTTGHWWTFAVPANPSCTHGTCRNHSSTSYDEGRFDPAPGSWHHVAGVLDRTRETLGVYIDGKPADNRIAEHVWNALGPFTVGAGQDVYPGADSFDGAIDEVRTWGRALSPAEVWRLYRAEAG